MENIIVFEETRICTHHVVAYGVKEYNDTDTIWLMFTGGGATEVKVKDAEEALKQIDDMILNP